MVKWLAERVHENKMVEYRLRFLAKYTSAERESKVKHERMKEHDRELKLRPFLSAPIRQGIILLWDEVKLIDRDPHWYSRRVKEGIHIISDFTLTISIGTVNSPKSSSSIVFDCRFHRTTIRPSCCRSSSGDSVDLLSRTICTTVVVSDWSITNLPHGSCVSRGGPSTPAPPPTLYHGGGMNLHVRPRV